MNKKYYHRYVCVCVLSLINHLKELVIEETMNVVCNNDTVLQKHRFKAE